MHNIYFTRSSCSHNQKWKSNAHKFSFCYEINSNRQNLGEENGALLVNEFRRHCIKTKRNFTFISSDDNYKYHVPFFNKKKILHEYIKAYLQIFNFLSQIKNSLKTGEKCEKTGYHEADSKNRNLPFKIVELASMYSPKSILHVRW